MKIQLRNLTAICVLTMAIPILVRAQTVPLIRSQPLENLTLALSSLDGELTPVKGLSCPHLDKAQAERVGEALGHMDDLLNRYRTEVRDGLTVAQRHHDQLSKSAHDKSFFDGAAQELARWRLARQQIDGALERLHSTRILFDAAMSGYFYGRISNKVEAQPRFNTPREAIRHLETVLPKKVDGLSVTMRGFTVRRPIAPRLFLPKSSFSPGEAIEVRFIAPACLSARAWIGLLPAATPHGSALTNDQHDLAYKRMGKETEGKFLFIAPNPAGDYDLRMNSDSDGVELVTVPFKVARSATAEGRSLMVPDGVTLQASVGKIKSETIRIHDKSGSR